METRIIYIIFLVVPPPSPSPNQIPSEIDAEWKYDRDMSGNEELPNNKARKTQMSQKGRQVDMVSQGDKHSIAKSGPDFSLFAKGHNYISQGQV